MVKVGENAPDFKLEGVLNGKFKEFALKDYKNKWLVVFFYPLDFTFVCPTEIREFSTHAKDFKKLKKGDTTIQAYLSKLTMWRILRSKHIGLRKYWELNETFYIPRR